MSRFASLNEEDINRILVEKDAARTRKAADQSWRVLLAYCEEKKITFDIKSISKSELNELLKRFYFEVRKPDGGEYRKNSLNCIRFGINRKIKTVHKEWDIIHDVEFNSSCTAFTAEVTELKRKGLAKVEHYPPITEADMKKLYSSGIFNLENPKNLQWKVFFELLFYLCRRGEENLRTLTKDHFKIKMASDNSRYIEKVIDELDKNHRTNDDNEQGGIIQEQPNNPMCPVRSFELYMSKLNPNINALFQRAKKNPNKDGPWYDASPVGANTISKFMKEMSKNADLSILYSNHSIRATTITMLDAAGYEARHITSLTGHKSYESLKTYCRTSVGTKRTMSEVLSSSISVDNESSSSGSKQVCRSRNFDFGISWDKDNAIENPSSSRHSTRGDIPLLMKNNTNCTFNINF